MRHVECADKAAASKHTIGAARHDMVWWTVPACRGGVRKQHGELAVLCRYQWLGIAPRNLDWWGAFSYTVGVGLYWIAALSTMINDCPNTTLDPIVYVSCLQHACFVRLLMHLYK